MEIRRRKRKWDTLGGGHSWDGTSYIRLDKSGPRKTIDSGTVSGVKIKMYLYLVVCFRAMANANENQLSVTTLNRGVPY